MGEGDTDSGRFLKTIWPRKDYVFVLTLLIVCFVLSIWGNGWGAPKFWHPDEVSQRSSMMVSKKRLNPGAFQYGGLHYYVIAGTVVLPLKLYRIGFEGKPASTDTYSLKAWAERYKKNLIRLSRSVTAVMSTLVVFITFLIGTILFGRKVGLLAAVFLTLSSSFIVISHFAAVDGPANFWFWLSCLFSLLLWKRGGLRWYVLAAISAGLAFGTKIDRVLVLLPILISILLTSERNKLKHIAGVAALSLLAFIFANPLIITSPFEYFEGTLRDLVFNMMRPREDQTPVYTAMSFIVSGLGLPLFIAAALGLIYGIYNINRNKDSKEYLWLLFTFLPYYFIFSFKLSYYYYFPIMFPALAILAAKLSIDTTASLHRSYGVIAKALIVIIVVFSLCNTFASILQLSRDSRYQAEQWIQEKVPAGARIEVLDRGPMVSEEKYIVTEPLKDKAFYDVAFQLRDEMAANSVYQNINSVLLRIETFLNRYVGFTLRKQPYQAWFDRWTSKYEGQLPMANEEEGSDKAHSDYIVIVDYLQPEKLSRLESQDSGFEQVAHFHYVGPLGIQYPILFVNPHIYIFHRADDIVSNLGSGH